MQVVRLRSVPIGVAVAVAVLVWVGDGEFFVFGFLVGVCGCSFRQVFCRSAAQAENFL